MKKPSTIKVPVKIVSKLLEPGKSMTRKQFIRLASKLDPVLASMDPNSHKFNLRLVSAQARFNKVLMDSGLYLKSKDYYTRFNVLERPAKEVGRYYGQSKTKQYLGKKLADGISKPKPLTHYF